MGNEPKIEWEQAIREAQNLVKSSKQSQMAVAKLASGVCEIVHGGSKQERKTLRDFATEAGLAYNTLQQWVTVYRNVYSKIADELKFGVPYTKLLNVAYSVHPGATSSEVTEVFHENLRITSGNNSRALTYIWNVRSLISNFKEGYDGLFSIEVAEEAAFYASTLLKLLKRHGVEPKDNGLTKSNGRNIRLAALDEGSLRQAGGALSVNDRLIIEEMKKAGGYVSPSVLGRVVFKTQTPMAAKLRALRTMTKLLHHKKAVVNKDGHYRLTPNAFDKVDYGVAPKRARK
jgi:hypothetical protein